MKSSKLILIGLALIAAAGAQQLSAATYYVDCRGGSDSNDGLSSGTAFKTLKKATSVLKAGDVLELAPGAKFHESLEMASGGTPQSPIAIHGNGAVLSGLAPVPDDSWKKMNGGLWLSANKAKWGALRPRVLDREGVWRSVAFSSNGKDDPKSLKPGEAMWKSEGIWFRPENGRGPQDYGLHGFYLESGFKIDANSYITVDDLVCENFANDGFNVHGTCAGLVFRNVEGRYNGDDGFSVHEDVQANVYGGFFHHNDYGIQDISASQSSFCGVTVVSNRLHGVDLLGGLRVIRDSVVRDNAFGQIRIRGNAGSHMGWDRGNPLFKARAYLEHVVAGPGDGAALAVGKDAGVTACRCEFSGTDYGAEVSDDGVLHLVRTKIGGCRKDSVKRNGNSEVAAKDCDINPPIAPLPSAPQVAHSVKNTALTTVWGEKVTAENAWREYPRPQMERADWTCLNGKWRYAVTSTTNTFTRPVKWAGEILVPFALESKLSGVGRALAPDEFLWYQRSFALTGRKAGERVLLHFECADWRTQVWIGDTEVTDAPHEGGNVPFSLDITDYVRGGDNLLTVLIWDPTETFLGATGKQSLNPSGCHYTRSSGLVGSVWMERVPETHLANWLATPNLAAGTVEIRLDVDGNVPAASAEIVVSRGGTAVARASATNVTRPVRIQLPKPIAAWSPDSPSLYEVAISVKDRDADTSDEVKGYFGMRSFEWRLDEKGRPRFYLNGNKTYVMATLDQGWWPDGLLTPPSDEAMAFDVKVLKKCGFNALRKHIKVEPRRYYHMCDMLGMMVLQDMPSGRWLAKLHGLRADLTPRYGTFRAELKTMVDHLANSPSIVMWVPYNEGWGQTCAQQTSATLRWLKRYDPTRLVDGPSGWNDFEGGSLYTGGAAGYTPFAATEPDMDFSADILDMHKYPGPGMPPVGKRRVAFLGEFGGLGRRIDGHVWNPDPSVKSWGYGSGDIGKDRTKEYLAMMKTLEGFAARGLGGSVYTQTTDVEIEINGLITYDRRVVKYDPAVLRAAHAKVMAAAND